MPLLHTDKRFFINLQKDLPLKSAILRLLRFKQEFLPLVISAQKMCYPADKELHWFQSVIAIYLKSDAASFLNIGGFTNISFEKNGVMRAFDICPGNLPLNKLVRSKELGIR